MRFSWAYSIPHYHFDEAAQGTGTPSPGGGPGTPPASSGSPEPSPGPSPAPSPAPSGSPSAAPAAPGTDSSAAAVDAFAGLDGDFDDLDAIIVSDAPPTDGGAPQAVGADPAKPAPKAAPGAQPPAPPAAQPSPEPASVAPAATSPASPGARLNEAVEGFKSNSDAMSGWAAENLFRLSDEDAAALATNAEQVIPRLMGKVYAQALVAAGNLMRNFVPQMIQHDVGQINTRASRAKEAINAFYTAHSDLNEKDHGATVAKWAKSFRAANPKASREEAIKFVGNAVRLEHGLSAPQAAPQTTQPRAAFAPARPGGRVPPPPQTPDPFAGLDHDFDE